MATARLGPVGCHGGQVGQQREIGRRTSGAGVQPDRVGAEGAGELVYGETARRGETEERGSRLTGLRSGVEGDRREIDVDALQRRRQVGHRQADGAEAEPERRRAGLEVGEDRPRSLRVASGSACCGADVPADRRAPAAVGAADERRRAGNAGRTAGRSAAV